jgi:FkbM family methyltransferase
VGIASKARSTLTRSPRLYSVARRAAILSRYARKRVHEPDFEFFRGRGDGRGLFLDIGANAGQSALSFRAVNKGPILSIEPNPGHERDLKMVTRIIKDFEYRMCAVGAEPARATLYVPVYGRIELTGEASLLADDAARGFWVEAHTANDASELELREIDVEVIRIDDLGLAPAWVKIDVEGAEMEALRGMEKTLSEHRPVLMIEGSDTSYGELRPWLAERGFEAFGYDAKAGKLFEKGDVPTLNIFFVHSEDPLIADQTSSS